MLNEIEMERKDAEQADEEAFEAAAPRGKFTERGLKPLVAATNRLLRLFGQDPSYPEVSATSVLPADFTRVLSMFEAAIDEAVKLEVLDGEMEIDLSSLRDDTGLLALAGKLGKVTADKEFKKFLKEPMPEGEAEEVEEEPEAAPVERSEQEEDDIMLARMA